MLAIFKKELWNYFGNWSAWLIMAAFSIVVALFLFFFENDSNLLDIGNASLQSYFVLVPWLLMFAMPALAMRTLAEEQQNGTMQWLFTQPISISDIVLGKFFAVWLIGILCILPSLVYFYTIYTLGVPQGNMDFGAATGSYFGLLLLTGAFSGLGILASAMASNQIMAFLFGIFISFIAYFGIEQLANYKLLGGADFLLQNLGFYRHYLGFTRGLVDSRDLLYFSLMMMISVLLSIYFVKKKKTMSSKKVIIFAVMALFLMGAAGLFKFRFDLTKEKRYTLSDLSVKVLESVKSPLSIDVYLEGDFPASFRQLQSETRFMLEEFRRANPNISFKFIDPIKSKIPEDTLAAMGLKPSFLPDIKDGKISQTVLYPFVVLNYKKNRVSLPLIVQQHGVTPDEQLMKSIENLEYGLVSDIKSLTNTERKNIGILINQDELSPGEFSSFMRMATENYNAFPIIPKNQKELKFNDVPNLKRTQALVIAKPRKAFTDNEKLILDQYIMNGGRTLWMMDAVNAEMDTLMRAKKMMAFPIDANLNDFFFNYGLRINPALVKDLKKFALLRLVTGEVGGNPQYMSLPWPYFPLGVAESANAITKNINPVKFEFPTSIDTLGRPGIKTNVLFESSEMTLLKQVPNYVDLKEIAEVDSLGQNEKYSTPKIFAVSLEGKFRSAYATRSERANFPNFRSESPQNKMIVIADGDVGRNGIYKSKPLPLGVDLLTDQQYGNEQFLRNCLDYLLDDSNLMQLRNRNIEARLLDRQRIEEERSFWQWLNLLLPLAVIGLLAGLFYWLRRRKFTS